MKLDLNDGFVFSVPYLKDFSLFLKDTYHVVTKDQLMIQGLIYCLCFLYFIFGSPLFPTKTFWKINTKEKDDKRGEKFLFFVPGATISKGGLSLVFLCRSPNFELSWLGWRWPSIVEKNKGAPTSPPNLPLTVQSFKLTKVQCYIIKINKTHFVRVYARRVCQGFQTQVLGNTQLQREG